ncbi:MAG TPA: hypothetical protein VE684_10410, partial [Crenalkalicoccus sp.]|nr:hypothetical protein [Crenalkalicoccus sp.]
SLSLVVGLAPALDRGDRPSAVDDIGAAATDIPQLPGVRRLVVVADAILRHHDAEAQREGIDHGGA